MSDKMKAAGWLNDLDRIVKVRHQVAERLNAIATTLAQAESEGENLSGKLGLDREIERLIAESETLRQGVFRLLVLGDMKRGKSTFLNALLGQNLLPSDVNPCTALLTILKYGASEKVTIHYNDRKPPEEIDFEQFKQRYTINPAEAKVLEQGQKLAFPDVSHAVVEHPLPLLGKGIEFIDSPGLNDTEARNELSLNYVYNCHAILFVLSATQPCTLEERRYLQNYLQERGLSIFFLVNGWDRIRESLVDPEDTKTLQEAEEKLRQVFRSNLSDYCQELYPKRVFEISAIQALRARLKNSAATMEGTGYPEFLAALNHFLTQERATAEIERAKAIASWICDRFSGAIERRIPLLERTVEELQQQIHELQSDFDQLAKIGNQFQQEILAVRDREAKEIADSFKTYILDLDKTFEQDFLNSQPDLDFMQFFDKTNRAMFYSDFKRAFERYFNDRLAGWEFMAKQKLSATFSQLEAKAADYRVEYDQVVDRINSKLLGYRFYAIGHTYKPEHASTWADSVMDVFGSIPDSMNRGIGSFNRFWQSVLSCVCVTLVLQAIGLVFASITLSVLGGIALGIGVVGVQAELVRQQFIAATKKEFTKYLPEIAESQWQTVYDSVQKCFEVYENQVSDRINADINSRQAELNNLLTQKQSREINRSAETQRLKNLETAILSDLQDIQFIRQSLDFL
jgi:GTPase SAR1 family protein